MEAGRRWWSGLGVRGKRELLLLALLLFCYGFFQQAPAWNEYSRYDLVRALVEQGTTRIDSYQDNTGDKAFFQGHWYSDKAPGTALLGVPVYVVQSLSARLIGQDRPEDLTGVQALSFVESGIATAALVLLLVRFLAPLVGDGWALGVGLAYGLGSIAFPFATMFFGHAASTACLFAAFYLLYRQKERPPRWTALLAGFLAGWAVLIEIPVVLGVAALFVYALFVGRGTAVRFIAGGLPLLVLLLAYDWLSFGNPLSIGYQYTPAFQGQNAQGIISIVWPQLSTTSDLLFSPRGLIRLAPWFALAPLGMWAMRRRDARYEILLAAVICAAFLAYNSGALNPFGGWTPGPRYLLPALPFAAVLVAFVPTGLRFFTGALMVAAAAVFFAATVTMPNAPERFIDPLYELWLPRLRSGELAQSGAWIRWGLDELAVVVLFVLLVAFGLIALRVSLSHGPIATRITGRAAALVALLTLAFSLPFPPPAPVALGWEGGTSPPAITIAEIGNTPMIVEHAREVELWARIEDRGGAVPAARMQFSVWTSTGEGVWSAWYGSVPVAAASRQTISMTWHPEGLPPGRYAYGFMVTDASSNAQYANALARDMVVLGR